MARTQRLDKVFPEPIGRIQKSYGTHDLAIIAGIDTMVSEYARNPFNHDKLIQIRDGKVTLLNAYANRTTGAKIIVKDASQFDPMAFDWLDAFSKEHRSESTISRYRECFNALVTQYPDGKGELSYERPPIDPKKKTPSSRINFPLSQLPAQLAEYRVACVNRGTAEQFNKTRNACRSILNNKFSEDHDIYRSVKKVKPIEGAPTKTRTDPASVIEVLHTCAKLKPAHAAQFFSMCLTGSGWTEYKAGVTVDPNTNGLRIPGEKMKRVDNRRDRIVPNVQNISPFRDGQKFEHPAPIAIERQKFLVNLKDNSGGKIKIETARKCFANWTLHAGIPYDRREQYMGHAAQTMTDRYARETVQQWLAEDAELLRAYIEKQNAIKVNPNAAALFDFS